jgi:hypothetical protein
MRKIIALVAILASAVPLMRASHGASLTQSLVTTKLAPDSTIALAGDYPSLTNTVSLVVEHRLATPLALSFRWSAVHSAAHGNVGTLGLKLTF